MTSSRRIHLCLAVILTAIAPATARAADLRQIWEKLRERQAAAETARVGFSVSRTLSPDYLARRGGPHMPPTGDTGELVVPPHPSLLELSGERVRYESSLLSFAGGDRGETVPSISAFDGTYQQYFSDRSGRPQGASNGSVKSMDQFDEWQNVAILPPLYALRPLRRETFGPNPSPWRQETRTAVIDGADCLVMTRLAWDSPPEARIVVRAYLDPVRDFVPLRVESEIQGRPSVRMDMRYERTEPPVWVPSEWSSTWLTKSGKLSSEYRGRLEKVALGEPIADERFVIDFPPGTEVVDGRPGGGMMVVAGDGRLVSRRQVEAEATAGGTKWWPWLAAAGAAVLGGALLLWRRGVVLSR